MFYLASTSQGKFLVEGDNWVRACEALRLASAVPADESPVMITGFANPIRGVYKAMTNFASVNSDDLGAAIVSYGESCVDLSWLGSKDAESHESIRQEFEHAKQYVEILVGQRLPK